MGYSRYCSDCDVRCSDKRTTNISIIFIAERQRHPLKCTHNSGAATISSTTTSNHFHSFDGNTNINLYILNDGDGGSNGIALYASLICCKLSIVHIWNNFNWNSSHKGSFHRCVAFMCHQTRTKSCYLFGNTLQQQNTLNALWPTWADHAYLFMWHVIFATSMTQ